MHCVFFINLGDPIIQIIFGPSLPGHYLEQYLEEEKFGIMDLTDFKVIYELVHTQHSVFTRYAKVLVYQMLQVLSTCQLPSIILPAKGILFCM